MKTATKITGKIKSERIEEALIKPPKIIRGITRNSYWLNTELKKQIELAKESSSMYTKIQLFQKLDYSKNKFDYWMRKNGNVPHTQELQKKLDEIFEAKLITQGFESRNPVFTIFLLKNNYNYQDNRTIDTNNNYTFNVTRGDIKPLKRKVIDSTASRTIPTVAHSTLDDIT